MPICVKATVKISSLLLSILVFVVVLVLGFWGELFVLFVFCIPEKRKLILQCKCTFK